jgi:hypothetical protein
VERLTISCGACGHDWQVATAFSLYEQQAVESSPCPGCGAYTLHLHEPAEKGFAARRRHFPASTFARNRRRVT